MMFILNLLGLGRYQKLIVPLLIIVVVGGVGYSLYSFGYSRATTQFELQQEKEFKDTAEKVRKGSDEVRKANPTGDPSVALDRLRKRQSDR